MLRKKIASEKPTSPPEKVAGVEGDDRNEETKNHDDVVVASRRKNNRMGASKPTTPNPKGASKKIITIQKNKE